MFYAFGLFGHIKPLYYKWLIIQTHTFYGIIYIYILYNMSATINNEINLLNALNKASEIMDNQRDIKNAVMKEPGFYTNLNTGKGELPAHIERRFYFKGNYKSSQAGGGVCQVQSIEFAINAAILFAIVGVGVAGFINIIDPLKAWMTTSGFTPLVMEAIEGIYTVITALIKLSYNIITPVISGLVESGLEVVAAIPKVVSGGISLLQYLTKAFTFIKVNVASEIYVNAASALHIAGAAVNLSIFYGYAQTAREKVKSLWESVINLPARVRTLQSKIGNEVKRLRNKTTQYVSGKSECFSKTLRKSKKNIDMVIENLKKKVKENVNNTTDPVTTLICNLIDTIIEISNLVKNKADEIEKVTSSVYFYLDFIVRELFKSKIGIIGALEADGIKVPEKEKEGLEAATVALPPEVNEFMQKLADEFVEEAFRPALKEMETNASNGGGKKRKTRKHNNKTRNKGKSRKNKKKQDRMK